MYIAAPFAVLRMSQLISLDDGPFGIFDKIRAAAEAYAMGSKFGSFRWSLSAWLNCPYCNGVWFAALILLLICLRSTLGDIFILWMGLAGVQAVLQSGIRRE